MRRTTTSSAITAAIVGASLLSSPASAASIITSDYCADKGGTFQSVRGVKSCTTTSTQVESETASVSSPPEPDAANPGGTVYYTGWGLVYVYYRDTTVESQRGNDPVTERTTREVIGRDSSGIRACTATHEAVGQESYTEYVSILECSTRDLVPR